MPIKVIFFDAADTLFEVRGTVGEIYSRFALEHGIETDPADLQALFTEALRSSPPLAFSGLSGETLARAERFWWFQVVRPVFEKKMSPEILTACFDDVFRVFGRGEGWRLFPETRASLERLHQQYRLGIISNFDSRLFAVLEDLGIGSFFERVIISSRAGAAKPDPGIFQTALAAMNVAPTAALHVGDSPENDVEGARKAGLTGILLDRRERYAHLTDVRRISRIDDLRLTIDDLPPNSS